MKKGTRVRILETGRTGKVYNVDPMTKKPTHVQLDTGQIIKVLDKTLVVLSLLKWFWMEVKKLFK